MKKIVKALLLIGGTALAAHFWHENLQAPERRSQACQVFARVSEQRLWRTSQGEYQPQLQHHRYQDRLFQEIIDKHNDIETTVREYVDDFYPDLSKCSVDVSLYVPGTEEEDAEEEAAEETESQD
jgi:hypothetical protein